jgi:hypothetical protein
MSSCRLCARWSWPPNTSPGALLYRYDARIELYFHPIFREPIMAFGKVTNSVEQSRDEGFRIETELIEMPEMTGQGLARLALLTQRHQQARCSVLTVGRREA